MRWKTFFVYVLLMAVVLTGCGTVLGGNGTAVKEEKQEGEVAKEDAGDSGNDVDEKTAKQVADFTVEEQFTNRDLSGDYDESKAETLSFTEDGIETSSKEVSVEGTTATIQSEGIYVLSGTCSDGMVIVDADKSEKIQIVLKNVTLHSESSAAIYVKQADKVFLTLADGTKNLLSSGSEYVAIDENNIDAAIFSKDDLTLNGTGTLGVESPAGHGIVGKDDLKFTGGTYAVKAAKHAVSANDSVRIANGDFGIIAQEDAFHSDDYIYIAGGEFKIETGDDAFHADNTLVVEDGTISVISCYEGLEAQVINIAGGDIDIVASDDGVNAAGGNDSSSTANEFGKHDMFDTDADASITISGGVLRLSAEGDGLDSNGYITITGGETYVTGPTNSGNGSLDYGIEAVIRGGIFVAAGASGMAENFGDASTQGCIMVTTDRQEAGSSIALSDASGTGLITWISDKAYDCVLISLPEIKEGSTYTLQAGNFSQEITMDTLVYGTGSGMGFGGGRGGQRGMDRGNFDPNQMPDQNQIPDGNQPPDGNQAPDGNQMPDDNGGPGGAPGMNRKGGNRKREGM